jgi:O-acetyl-ADP-ribose deacetylase (regulator of RNase III)
MSATIELAQCDISSVRADAIVNAANEALQLGEGVAGAIRRRGGATIQEECDRLGSCPTGQAVVTGAGNLPAKWVIHTVGPVWRGGELGEEMLLASAVRAALKRAEELGARFVALPAISTGVYGFPLHLAADISMAAARSFAEKTVVVEKILFCLFDTASLRAFEKAFERG